MSAEKTIRGNPTRCPGFFVCNQREESSKNGLASSIMQCSEDEILKRAESNSCWPRNRREFNTERKGDTHIE